MLDFLKILNMGFCCTIIGKFHVENEKVLPNKFRLVHTFRFLAPSYQYFCKTAKAKQPQLQELWSANPF